MNSYSHLNLFRSFCRDTSLKTLPSLKLTNIAPENWCLEYDPFLLGQNFACFQGLFLLNSSEQLEKRMVIWMNRFRGMWVGSSQDGRMFHQKEKLGTHGRVPEIYTNIYHLYMGYNCFMGQYGVMSWEQLLGYLPKGTQNFPLISVVNWPMVSLSPLKQDWVVLLDPFQMAYCKWLK